MSRSNVRANWRIWPWSTVQLETAARRQQRREDVQAVRPDAPPARRPTPRLPSHQLLVRGGFIRPIGAGLYAYLPLGWRVVRKIEAILRDEMERVGGQEVLMPLVNPADLWRETGRYASSARSSFASPTERTASSSSR